MFIVHLLVSYAHVNLCNFFSSSLCQGLAATSACGSSGLFCLPFFIYYSLFGLLECLVMSLTLT